MRIQIWSCYYEPEPQGNGPVVAALARALVARGHTVHVIAAHPHYPEAAWGIRFVPYREQIAGVNVWRLPTWPGRASGWQRIRHDLVHTAMQSAAMAVTPAVDALIAVTPCFPALLPAMTYAKFRKVPWLMWVQDIVTEAAASTGQLRDGALLRLARGVEAATYDAADRVVVISDSFAERLAARGLPPRKISRIFNPSGRTAERPNDVAELASVDRPQILAMGNIGLSQGLEDVVTAFQADEWFAASDARLVIAGGGVRAAEVSALISSPSITMAGVLHGERLTPVLERTALGLVTQRHDVAEFNFPSKLMTFFAYGIPVIASVRPSSETARVVSTSGGGWVVDSRDPSALPRKVGEVLRDRASLAERGACAFSYGRRHFAPERVAVAFEDTIRDVRESRFSAACP